MYKFIVVSIMILGIILSPFSVYAECTPSPKEITVADASSDVSKAPVSFSSNTFTLNFPAYCNPVDIYFAIATPENKLIFTDLNGKLTQEFIPYVAGGTSAVNKSFSIAGDSLASELTGKCVLYWLVAPTNGGDILKSIELGNYELGWSDIEEPDFSECFASGLHWYNNKCNVNPRSSEEIKTDTAQILEGFENLTKESGDSQLFVVMGEAIEQIWTETTNPADRAVIAAILEPLTVLTDYLDSSLYSLKSANRDVKAGSGECDTSKHIKIEQTNERLEMAQKVRSIVSNIDRLKLDKIIPQWATLILVTNITTKLVEHAAKLMELKLSKIYFEDNIADIIYKNQEYSVCLKGDFTRPTGLPVVGLNVIIDTAVSIATDQIKKVDLSYTQEVIVKNLKKEAAALLKNFLEQPVKNLFDEIGKLPPELNITLDVNTLKNKYTVSFDSVYESKEEGTKECTEELELKEYNPNQSLVSFNGKTFELTERLAAYGLQAWSFKLKMMIWFAKEEKSITALSEILTAQNRSPVGKDVVKTCEAMGTVDIGLSQELFDDPDFDPLCLEFTLDELMYGQVMNIPNFKLMPADFTIRYENDRKVEGSGAHDRFSITAYDGATRGERDTAYISIDIYTDEICGDNIDNDNDKLIDENCYSVNIYVEDDQCKDDSIGLMVDGIDYGSTPIGHGRYYDIEDLSEGLHIVTLTGLYSGGESFKCQPGDVVSYGISITGYGSYSSTIQVGSSIQFEFEIKK